MSTALILSGGGARAAYQVGVLRGVMEIHGRDQLPFDVICGTSAGAINAVFMAANAHRPRDGVERLYRAWRGISAGDVYDHGWVAVLGNLWRIARSAFSRDGRAAPGALLDNAPLRLMLRNWLELMAALPWAKQDPDEIDIPKARAVLEADHYGLDKVPSAPRSRWST